MDQEEFNNPPSNEVRTPLETKTDDAVYDDFVYPGVEVVSLSENTQAFISCEIGPDLNCEKPWKEADKMLLINHIEIYGDVSEFAQFEESLKHNPEFIILIGYLVNESRNQDNFYICLTKEAREHCQARADALLRIQNEELQRIIIKEPREWVSLKSEFEIIDILPRVRRKLYQVHVRLKYPQSSQPQFFVSQDAFLNLEPNGETTNLRDLDNFVLRLRADSGIQSVPLPTAKHVQTQLKYPRYIWTQTIDIDADYKEERATNFDSDNENESMDRMQKSTHLDDPNLIILKEKLRRHSFFDGINNFVTKNLNIVEEMLKFNNTVDFYSNDYAKLVRDDSTRFNFSIYFSEYICFTNWRVKDKLVSCATFHPVWTGVVAICYSKSCPSIYRSIEPSEDPVNNASYRSNDVFIWSCTDTCSPIIVLKSLHEVRYLTFCPFNKNIVVGGCSNGRILVWDLTGCQTETHKNDDHVEKRAALSNRENWLDFHQKEPVPLHLASSLSNGHSGPISQIKWIAATFNDNLTGLKCMSSKSKDKSSVILSGSEDGTILIWDLSLNHIITESMTTKVSKRLAKMPESLPNTSHSFSILNNGNLIPIYKIFLGAPGILRNVPIQNFIINRPSYICKDAIVTQCSRKKVFEGVVKAQEEHDMSQTIYCGSIYGEVIKAEWKDRATKTDEQVQSEYCAFIFRVGLHDGIVTDVLINPFISHVFLTVGGQIFAIWTDQFDKKPLVWKKHTNRLTGARWSPYKASIVFITTSNGTIETYDFSIRSDRPIVTQTIAGGQITNISVYESNRKQDFIGVGNIDGTFTLFFAPDIFKNTGKTHIENMKKILNNELDVKQSYQRWYSKWCSDNVRMFEEVQAKQKASLADQEKKLKEEIEEEEKVRVEKEKMKRKNRTKPSPEQKWLCFIDDLIEETIKIRKYINQAELLEKEKPLRDIEKERLDKKRKLAEAMEKQRAVFEETVGILFPEARNGTYDNEELNRNNLAYKADKIDDLSQYELIKRDAEKSIEKMPFEHNLKIAKIFLDGASRRRSLNPLNDLKEIRVRHFEKRMAEIANIKKPEEMQRSLEVEISKSSSDAVKQTINLQHRVNFQVHEAFDDQYNTGRVQTESITAVPVDK